MPTIEIASLKSTGLNLMQDDFVSNIIEDKILESHRGLFYDFLLKQKGVIIHIANPDSKNNRGGGFFAGELVDWKFENRESDEKKKEVKIDKEDYCANQGFNFQFKIDYKDEIEKLMEIAINKSPINKIYFLTDYQFGPEKPGFKFLSGLKTFWSLHDKNGLNWNTLYEIHIKR